MGKTSGVGAASAGAGARASGGAAVPAGLPASRSKIHFTPSQRSRDEGQRTVWVSVARLNRGFQKDVGFAIGPRGKGAIPGRMEAFRSFLGKAGTKKRPIEMPEVTVGPKGVVSFRDGRHRFAVLRDMGARQIPVSVPKEQAARLRRLYGIKKPKSK